MKTTRILSLVLVVVMLLSTLVSCFGGDVEEKETITIWVSEVEGVSDLTKTQVARFLEAHPEYSKYEIKVEGVSEADATSQVLTDVASAPDFY